jgi:Pyruvate/2-oxoacid:ferredoxin oxidoreductase gamma subunit
LEIPETRAKVLRFPFIRASVEISRLSIGTVALGTLLRDTGMFPLEAFTAAIRAFQKPKIAEINVKAAEAGANLVKTGVSN